MKNQIIIRQYKDEDKYQILDLLNRTFEKQQHLNIDRDIEWWEWKYEKNIFGKPIIYVAEQDNKIIGVRPFWPWKLSIRGEEFNCFQPLDSAVDKEFRGKGLFSKLTKTAIKENKGNIDLIFNFPNEQSIGSYLRLGWTFIGNLQWYVKANKIFKCYELIKNYSGFESYHLDKDDLISEEKIKQVKNNFNFNGKLKTLKTEEFLSWRFLEHPKINYGMNIIEKNRKKLIYIYEINQNDYGRELIVLDYFGEMVLFEDMLREVDHLSKKYHVAYTLILKKFNTPMKKLIKNFYIKKKKKNFVVLPLNLGLENIVTQYNNWDLFLGMHDSV
ncbi:GNAT family N-acetyltransferase [Crassaminicella profunda]|uniref:GNAT family N-acetyltransferase n=1 Tax=Crassaminicella profunda TaxID=1286698 RepID=UPI001CA610BE|nr:GNAT family N-acetyltransferase [Crassaminicella profunda]QZY55545.1 GNAT family N-acetyltransferase [Crassaminicella profunda]